METLIEQIENNKNMNGGGLAVNITGKYESNRHAIAKIEKVTFGEAVAFLKKKKNGGLLTDAKTLLTAYTSILGEPEWHHAGFLPKSYGGGMKKTYFLNDFLTKQEVEKLYLEYDEKCVLEEKEQAELKIVEEIKMNFLKENATQFSKKSGTPNNFCVKTYWECNGKYGWFSAEKNIYKMDEYVSGWSFENEEKYNEYRNL